MGLPVFSRDDLARAARRNDLIRETAAQIIKDFGEFSLDLTFSGEADFFYDELAGQMAAHVAYLVQNSYSRFMGLLYRIDISSKEIEQYAEEMKDYAYPEVITELIIHRELKKVLFRDYFRTQN
jgi:hypothetical protein